MKIITKIQTHCSSRVFPHRHFTLGSIVQSFLQCFLLENYLSLMQILYLGTVGNFPYTDLLQLDTASWFDSKLVFQWGTNPHIIRNTLPHRQWISKHNGRSCQIPFVIKIVSMTCKSGYLMSPLYTRVSTVPWYTNVERSGVEQTAWGRQVTLYHRSVWRSQRAKSPRPSWWGESHNRAEPVLVFVSLL